MNDFYMESEIKDRERQIRQRQDTPRAGEGRSFIAPILGFIVWSICLPLGSRLRLRGKQALAPTAPNREAKSVGR